MPNMASLLRDMVGWMYRWPAAGAQAFPGYGGPMLGTPLPFYGGYTADYNEVARIQVKEELLTIAAAANSNTVDTAFLPANSLILAVVGRVTVAIPTAATFNVGDATQASRFASGVAVAANTTFVGFLQDNPAVASDALGWRQTANASVRITPNATPGNANGRIRLQTFFITFSPPNAERAGP